MKKLLGLIVALVTLSTVVMAGVEVKIGNTDYYVTATIDGKEYYQAKMENFVFTDKPGQDQWEYSDMMTIKIPNGGEVWISNYISNWGSYYGGEDNKGDNGKPYTDLGTIYDMNEGKFGYIDASIIQNLSIENKYQVKKEDYDANGIVVTSGDGTVKTITYTKSTENLPDFTRTTEAYLLGTFDPGSEIYLAMTPLNQYGSNQLLDTYQFDNDYASGSPLEPDTNLASRKLTADGQTDFAGNIRVNFGYINNASEIFDPNRNTGAEFVLFFERPQPVTTGQPLPGGLLAGLLAFGTVAAGSLKKKRS